MLSQVQEDGLEHVIAYASRVLSKAERQYCVTRRELLAVVHFTQHFRPYLLGRRFTLRTDHGSLAWLKNFKDPTGQLARWLEKLQEFDFEVVHRPGRNADALSRMPCHQCGRDSHYLSVSVNFFQADGSLEDGSLWQSSADEMRQLQTEDEVLGPLLRALENKSKPTENNFQGESAESRRLLQLWDQLVSKEFSTDCLLINRLLAHHCSL